MLIVQVLALAAAQAVPGPLDRADAKCVFAMTMLGDSASGTDKAALDMTMSYFLGKIVGRSGSVVVGPAIEAVAQEMQGGGVEGAAKVAESCADEFGRATDGL